jgi:hypothetical protein
MSSQDPQPAGEQKTTGGRRPAWKRWAAYAGIAVVALVIGVAVAQPETEIKTETVTQTVTAPSPEAAARDALDAEVAELEEAASDARSKARTAKRERREAAREQRAAERRSEKRLERLRSQARGARSEIARSRFDGDGTFIVNDDITPGTYKADSAGESCYWERTSKDGEIIANDNTDGNAVIVVEPSDFSVTTARCGTFRKAGS